MSTNTFCFIILIFEFLNFYNLILNNKPLIIIKSSRIKHFNNKKYKQTVINIKKNKHEELIRSLE